MPETKKEVIEKYIDYRSITNHTRKIKDIEFQITQFLKFTNKPLSQFNEALLVSYINSIKDKYSTTNLNILKSSILKNFIKWHFKDYSERFPNLDRIMKSEKAAPSYTAKDMLTEKDFEKMIKTEESFFWKAYFMTMFYGGCRPSEVLNLRRKDIEFEGDGAYITIFSEKNKSEFIKYIPKDSTFYLKKVYDKGFDVVFTNEKTEKPLTIKGAYWKIRKLSEQALGRKIDLYTLRHSIATIIYNKEGFKDDDIARQMGHTKSMKSTYVHNDKEKLKEKAKRIYVSPETLPPEEENELKAEIKNLNEVLEETLKRIEYLEKDSPKKSLVLDEDVVEFVKKNAKDKNISEDESFNQIIAEGLRHK